VLNAASGSASGGADAVSTATGASNILAKLIRVSASAVSSATQAVSQVADTVSSASGAASTVADTVSSASGVVAEAAEAVASGPVVLINWKVWQLFQVVLMSTKPLATSTISDYAFWLNIPLMRWFINTLVLPFTPMQLIMQCIIVALEILVGLAFLGGLFTFPASVVSLILQFMFITTTGVYLGTVWMIVAAVACLIGAGRTLGMDYYAMPLLKRQWKKVRWAKKWYLYND